VKPVAVTETQKAAILAAAGYEASTHDPHATELLQRVRLAMGRALLVKEQIDRAPSAAHWRDETERVIQALEQAAVALSGAPLPVRRLARAEWRAAKEAAKAIIERLETVRVRLRGFPVSTGRPAVRPEARSLNSRASGAIGGALGGIRCRGATGRRVRTHAAVQRERRGRDAGVAGSEGGGATLLVRPSAKTNGTMTLVGADVLVVETGEILASVGWEVPNEAVESALEAVVARVGRTVGRAPRR
jgi:hypothetical protein